MTSSSLRTSLLALALIAPTVGLVGADTDGALAQVNPTGGQTFSAGGTAPPPSLPPPSGGLPIIITGLPTDCVPGSPNCGGPGRGDPPPGADCPAGLPNCIPPPPPGGECKQGNPNCPPPPGGECKPNDPNCGPVVCLGPNCDPGKKQPPCLGPNCDPGDKGKPGGDPVGKAEAALNTCGDADTATRPEERRVAMAGPNRGVPARRGETTAKRKLEANGGVVPCANADSSGRRQR